MCKECNEKELTEDQISAVSKLSEDIINMGMTIRHLRNGKTAYAIIKSDVSFLLKKGSKVLISQMITNHVDLYGGRFKVFYGKTEYTVTGDQIDFLTVDWN